MFLGFLIFGGLKNFKGFRVSVMLNPNTPWNSGPGLDVAARQSATCHVVLVMTPIISRPPCTHIHIYIYTYTLIKICICIRLYMHMYACLYESMYACMYVHVCM